MASRQYVVGVPLVVTVEGGVVTYEVDASEISQEMSERFGEDEDADWNEDQMLLDGAVVDAHLHAGHFPSTTLDQWTKPVCPVRYSCEFASADLKVLAHHIASFDHSDADKF